MAATLINQWTNVVSFERNEIVFENRNKAYGAYIIRQEYSRTILISLFYTIAAVMLLASIPKIVSLFKNEEIVLCDKSGQVNTPVVIERTIELPVEPKPMEHSHIEQPKVETQRLTPPVVVDEPKNVESIVSQSTEEIHVGTKTQIGDSGVGINTIEENTRNAPVEIIDDTPMMGPEIMPEFPGGPQKMYEFIRQNMVYPPIELENRIQGKLFMTFVVDRSGNIKDVQTLRGVPGGPNLAKEALRVIRLMPQWNPGRQNGRPVSVQLNLPFVFAAY